MKSWPASNVVAAGGAVAASGLALAGRFGHRGPPATVALALLLFAIGALGWRLAILLLPERRGAERALGAMIASCSSAVVIATALGTLGLLTREFALATLALVLTGFAAAPAPRRARDARAGEGIAAALESGRERSAVLATAMFVAVCVSTIAYDSAAVRARPPGSWHYDDLSYHLTAVATWRSWGDLRMPKFDVGDRSTPFYPIAGEIYSWWLLVPGGVDYFARWSELPAACGLLLALFCLGRRLGVSEEGTVLAGLLALTVPRVFPELAHSAGNDLWVAFGMLALAYAFVHAATERNLGAAVLVGASAGLLAGTKYTGLCYAVLIAAVSLVSMDRPRPRWKWVAATLAVATLVGGFPYVRNLVGTGNPVYPQPLSLLGFDVLPGAKAADVVRRAKDEVEGAFDPVDFVLARTDLFGEWFRWLLLPAWIAAPLLGLLLARTRSGAFREARRDLWLMLPLASYGVFVFLTPDHRDLRYFYGAIPLSGLALGWVLDRWTTVGRTIALGAGVAVVISLLAGRWSYRGGERLSTVLVLAALLASAHRAGPVGPRRGAKVAIAVCLVLAFSVAFGGAGSIRRYLDRRYSNFPVAARFEELASSDGVTVVVTATNQVYPYFGSRLQNRVEPLPSLKRLEDRHWNWGRSFVTVPVDRVRPEVLEHLDDLEVDWVVVGGLADARRLERLLGASGRWALVESVRDWNFWRRRQRPGAGRQGPTRLHQEVVPDSKPSE